MIKVRFNPNGPPLKASIDFYGRLTASYVYTLWERNSNSKVDERSGNNQNSQDDKYPLPTPVNDNVGRIIEFFSTLNNSSENDEKEIVAIKITQGDILIFAEEHPEGFRVSDEIYTLAKEITVAGGSTQLHNPFITLFI